ncbi:MAG: hypothetical protein DRO15_04515 [Thermoprotei archaeon]|nr:MAG: hypothetical protein DRO15_04515 [Thermoprotei archaeon]
MDKEVKRMVRIARPIKEKANEIRQIIERGGWDPRNYPRLDKIPDKYPKNLCVVAVDTGFTEPSVELTGGRLVIVIKAHAFFGCEPRCIGGKEATALVKFLESEEGIAKPISKIVERRFIVDLLKRKELGELHVDMIILDGELIPRIPPGYRRRSERLMMKLYTRIIDLSNEMFKLAFNTKTALVGVIKRSYGHFLGPLINMPELELNDKAIATYILKPGEYIDLGYYFDIIDKTRGVLENLEKKKVKGSIVRTLKQRVEWLRKIVDNVDWSGHTRIILYKSWVPSYFSLATKVEVWPSDNLPTDSILGYLAASTGINGVPYQIDVVDSMCRIPRSLLLETQQQLFRDLAIKLEDVKLAMSIAGLTNPEKMARIGFK